MTIRALTSVRRFPLTLASLALLGFSGTAVQAADLIVLESRGINLKPGQTVNSERPLALKQGQHLTLISPAGVTLKLDGPYEKAPAGDQARGVPVSKALQMLITQRQARVGEVGTTRGLAPNTLPDPWVLDASRAGTVCLREGSEAVLWRPDSVREAELALAPADKSWKTQARWPAGADRIKVPAPAVIHGGETYLVSVGGMQSALNVESVPANLPNDQVRAAWLANKDCEAQARALLRNGK